MGVIDLQQLFKSYKKWVSSNPTTVGDVETTIKWASYFVAGRITNSTIATELIYALSNLLCLLNDRILTEDYVARQNIASDADSSTVKLKLILTTLEYCEVFIELSAQRLWGTRGRWFLIVAVHLIKCVGRLILVLRKREKIVKSPPIPALDRVHLDKNFVQEITETNGFKEDTTCRLKKTGKMMRKIEGSPPLHSRNWKPLDSSSPAGHSFSSLPTFNSAELIYIFKPLVHLSGIGVFGYNDWKSWSIALIMDLISIRVYYGDRSNLTKDQKLELSKRCLAIFMYLMRSPMYDKFTAHKIDSVLGGLSRFIPMARFICKPVSLYIPVWQKTYFYMWST